MGKSRRVESDYAFAQPNTGEALDAPDWPR
jgi:hypothetical protein